MLNSTIRPILADSFRYTLRNAETWSFAAATAAVIDLNNSPQLSTRRKITPPDFPVPLTPAQQFFSTRHTYPLSSVHAFGEECYISDDSSRTKLSQPNVLALHKFGTPGGSESIPRLISSFSAERGRSDT